MDYLLQSCCSEAEMERSHTAEGSDHRHGHRCCAALGSYSSACLGFTFMKLHFKKTDFDLNVDFTTEIESAGYVVSLHFFQTLFPFQCC